MKKGRSHAASRKAISWVRRNACRDCAGLSARGMFTSKCSGICGAAKSGASANWPISPAPSDCRCWPPTVSNMPFPSSAEFWDVFTCARNHTHLDAAGRLLGANTERHLKSAVQMSELFDDFPEALDNTVILAKRLEFELKDLDYQFPIFSVPSGETEASFLRQRVMEGARNRYGIVREDLRRQLEKELALIEKIEGLRLLSLHLGFGSICQGARHHGSGSGQRGELRGVLLPRHHRLRSHQIPIAL